MCVLFKIKALIKVLPELLVFWNKAYHRLHYFSANLMDIEKIALIVEADITHIYAFVCINLDILFCN